MKIKKSDIEGEYNFTAIDPGAIYVEPPRPSEYITFNGVDHTSIHNVVRTNLGYYIVGSEENIVSTLRNQKPDMKPLKNLLSTI